MPETLLSFSEVLLFGRVVDDLKIPNADDAWKAKAATTKHEAALQGTGPVDGVNVAPGDSILVRKQNVESINGLYTVQNDGPKTWNQQKLPKGAIVYVEPGGTALGDTLWEQILPESSGNQKFKELLGKGKEKKLSRRLGGNRFLEGQLVENANFARIYGFSYEGAFYELPAPTIFLVHGDGESATAGNLPYGFGSPPNVAAGAADTHQASRAPLDPSITGVAAADYQIANDIRVWPYDKADYSIRMDVLTGQLEQILLDVFFEVEAPMIAGGRVAGGRVAGGRVAGGRVAGGRVAGGRVAGGRVSGGRVGGSGD